MREPVYIFGSNIYLARTYREVTRKALAMRLTGITGRTYRPSQIREMERQTASFEVPYSVFKGLGMYLSFPPQFFQRPLKTADIFKNAHFCRSFEESLCDVCGGEATKLCDGPGKKGKTCDAKICDDCALNMGEVDYCPDHYPQSLNVMKRVMEKAIKSNPDKVAAAMKAFQDEIRSVGQGRIDL